ncbi:TlpA family protein disulfide reductase [Nocardioides speluncae]|uniref:TlpA family protein disulfide reductase n=1 Tax=Nocardioides speluncae TaxID=2670337 RepID=UPI00137A99D7|nr:redoxin family protein [Nocardioides speluncae]
MRWVLAIVASLALLLAACGTQESSSPAPGSEVIGTGKVADLDFSGTTVDGSEFDGASLKGKPAVLWFWAPWCPTCRAQSPFVSDLAEEYDGRVAVIGVGGLDSESAILDLAGQIPHVTHLVDIEGAVWQHFRVTAQSTFTVIDADGEVMSEGYLDNEELGDLVARLAD